MDTVMGNTDFMLSYESVLDLYTTLIGDAVVIQPVYADAAPEKNRYDVIDTAYDLALHFYKTLHSPMPHLPNMTKRDLSLAQLVQHAEFCIDTLQRYHRATRRKAKNASKEKA